MIWIGMNWKKIIVILSVIVTLNPILLSVHEVSAAEYDTIELNPVEINKDDLLEYAIELGVYLTDDEVIITDSQLLKLLEFQGVEIPEDGSQGGISLFREGVTKIVSRGSGSWDIYLSASFIRNYYWTIGAAATLIGVMVPGIGAVAKTKSFRKNSSGNYYAMPVVTKETYDWVYAEVHINDGRIYSSNGTQLLSNSKIQAVLIHEMLHGYGLKDLYNSANRNSIMYGSISGTATGLTSDANRVLNSKY